MLAGQFPGSITAAKMALAPAHQTVPDTMDAALLCSGHN